jgi:hypothetical protein
MGKVEQPTLLDESHVSPPLPLELLQYLFGNSPEGIAARRLRPAAIRELNRPIATLGVALIVGVTVFDFTRLPEKGRAPSTSLNA